MVGAAACRSCTRAKTPTGSTTSSTGSRASSARSSREAWCRSAMIVRRTAAIEGSASTIAATTAAATASRTDVVESAVGKPMPGARSPVVEPAKAASARANSRPIGRATTAATPACSSWTRNSQLREKPRECRIANSKPCRAASNTPTPAITASPTSRICNATRNTGVCRSSTERRTSPINSGIPPSTWARPVVSVSSSRSSIVCCTVSSPWACSQVIRSQGR